MEISDEEIKRYIESVKQLRDSYEMAVEIETILRILVKKDVVGIEEINEEREKAKEIYFKQVKDGIKARLEIEKGLEGMLNKEE